MGKQSVWLLPAAFVAVLTLALWATLATGVLGSQGTSGDPEGAPFTIELVPGLNLISVPAPLVDPSLDAVFGNVEAVDLVFGRDQNLWLIAFRDTGSGEFLGTLTSIEDGQGYWVRASYFVSVTLDLLEVTELPSYEVGPGWTPTRTLLPRPLFPGTSGNTKSSLQGLWQTMYTFEHEQSGCALEGASVPIPPEGPPPFSPLVSCGPCLAEP